jgi:hypothetical protein
MPTLEGVNGSHFHMNTRSWRLLTDFLFDECSNVIKADERQGWHSNYGKIISSETAVAIADRLDRLIEEGIVEQHIIELSIVNMDTHFSENILRKFIEFCRHSGGFDIW